MDEAMRPYPEYKDSGLPWLGAIPAHWEVWRNSRLFTQRNETGYSDLPILEVSLKTGVRVRDFENGARKQVMTDREKYKQARRGDIAYNMMRMWQGAVGVAPADGLVSPAYVVARPQAEVDSRYYAYLFRTGAYKNEMNKYSHGIVTDRNRLYWDEFKQMPSAFPPLGEQRMIASFLDEHGRQVRRFIQNKRQLIEFLNEQKQAIIHRAVTRGLDPNVHMKPSGIDWLGDVPEHWESAALRHRYSVQLGKMLDAKRITGECLVPYLRNTDVQWDHIYIENLPKMDIDEREYGRYTIKPGDMLVCEGGDVGRSAFWTGGLSLCGFQKALHRVRPLKHQQDYPRFLFYLMFIASKLGVFIANGSENTIAHLTCEKLRRHRFPFPPRQEQEAIAKYLDETIIKINATIEKLQHEIDLMREYLTRLIADVVTGKLDVRGVAMAGLDIASDMDWDEIEAMEADEEAGALGVAEDDE